MNLRTVSVSVLTAAGASLIGAALAVSPVAGAAPGTDTSPSCLTEGTCAVLVPKSEHRYLPLTPTSAPQVAPLTPAHQ